LLSNSFPLFVLCPTGTISPVSGFIFLALALAAFWEAAARIDTPN
jgi:hypothetical protein